MHRWNTVLLLLTGAVGALGCTQHRAAAPVEAPAGSSGAVKGPGPGGPRAASPTDAAPSKKVARRPEDCPATAHELNLTPGASILDLRCDDTTSVVLTERELVAVIHDEPEPEAPTLWYHPMRIARVSLSVRYDLPDPAEVILVAWAHSTDRWFLLFTDGLVHVLPVDDSDAEAEAYRFQGVLTGITCFAGFVFLGGPEDVVVAAFSGGEAQSSRFLLARPLEKPEFFEVDGHLQWGTPGGRAVRFELDGPTLDLVRMHELEDA